MAERDTFDQSLIEPVYSQDEPNQPIVLGHETIELHHKGKPCRGMAEVRLRFVPTVRLSFDIPVEGEEQWFWVELGIDDAWDGKLKLLDRNVTVDVSFSSGKFGERGVCLRSKTSSVTLSPPGKKIATARFHLLNFPEFHSTQDYVIESREGTTCKSPGCGRVAFSADNWTITIATLENTHDLSKALKSQGGYVITHMGRIERDDGCPFSSKELDEILRCLYFFLSFVLGAWAGVALPIGFAKDGRRVFEQWGLPVTTPAPWRDSCSWFDTHHAELLSEVFPGFVALWKNTTWKDALKTVLYWYIEANQQGHTISTDVGVILAQVALELLAWTYCVQVQRMISAEAFGPRGLSAADKLRLLVSSLDIPLELPDSLVPFQPDRGQRKWQDSMDAITSVRNSLVHPAKRKSKYHGECLVAVWKLSLWYLEMVLLRLCGHHGEYANRLTSERWAGQVEPVPWTEAR